jgi:hypothetical protein
MHCVGDSPLSSHLRHVLRGALTKSGSSAGNYDMVFRPKRYGDMCRAIGTYRHPKNPKGSEGSFRSAKIRKDGLR